MVFRKLLGIGFPLSHVYVTSASCRRMSLAFHNAKLTLELKDLKCRNIIMELEHSISYKSDLNQLGLTVHSDLVRVQKSGTFSHV